MTKRKNLKERIGAIEGKSDEKKMLAEKLAALKPLSPKGDVIRRVRLEARSKKAVGVRADRADMVRVDVFTRPNRKSIDQFYLVPVYRNDVYNDNRTLKRNPPNRAVTVSKPEDDWPIVDECFGFKFSLYSFSLIEVTKSDGEVFFGYFRDLDRTNGAISLSEPQNSSQLHRGIGGRTLRSFRKFHVDRLGERHEIKQEVRTWHGRACT